MNYWVALIAASALSIAVRYVLPVAVFAWLLGELDVSWGLAAGVALIVWLGWVGLHRLGAWLWFWTYRRRARAAFIGQRLAAKGMPPPDEFFGTSPAYGPINYLETVWENGDDFYTPQMVEYAAYLFGFMEALRACAPGWVYRQERKALGDALAEMKARRGPYPPPTSDQFACYR